MCWIDIQGPVSMQLVSEDGEAGETEERGRTFLFFKGLTIVFPLGDKTLAPRQFSSTGHLEGPDHLSRNSYLCSIAGTENSWR